MSDQERPDRESIRVLDECIALQIRKSRDYQAEESRVRQADHYPNGVQTIQDMIWQKILRARSLTEKMRATGDHEGSEFESLEDTYKDIANYCSFAVSYLRGQMDGQSALTDAFGRLLTEDQIRDRVAASISRDEGVPVTMEIDDSLGPV